MFGLSLASDVELPSIGSSENSKVGLGAADICVYTRGLPKPSIELGCQLGAFAEAAPGEALVTVPGLGQFFISDGCRIDVEPESGYDPQTMELYLLGNMLGILLLQRRFLVMHGNVLEKNGNAIVVCGHSSAGKSALSAALVKGSGFRLLSDDLTVFDRQGNLRSGPSEIKLWLDTVRALKLPLENMQRLNAQVDKYRWVLEPGDHILGRVKATAVYILGSNNLAQNPEFSELIGMEKLVPLRNQVYRRQFIDAMGLSKPHFMMIPEIFGKLSVVRLNRALTGIQENTLQNLATAVADDFDNRRGVR